MEKVVFGSSLLQLLRTFCKSSIGLLIQPQKVFSVISAHTFSELFMCVPLVQGFVRRESLGIMRFCFLLFKGKLMSLRVSMLSFYMFLLPGLSKYPGCLTPSAKKRNLCPSLRVWVL